MLAVRRALGGVAGVRIVCTVLIQPGLRPSASKTWPAVKRLSRPTRAARTRRTPGTLMHAVRSPHPLVFAATSGSLQYRGGMPPTAT